MGPVEHLQEDHLLVGLRNKHNQLKEILNLKIHNLHLDQPKEEVQAQVQIQTPILILIKTKTKTKVLLLLLNPVQVLLVQGHLQVVQLPQVLREVHLLQGDQEMQVDLSTDHHLHKAVLQEVNQVQLQEQVATLVAPAITVIMAEDHHKLRHTPHYRRLSEWKN